MKDYWDLLLIRKRSASHAIRLALGKKVGLQVKSDLTRAVTVEEIKASMWSFKGNKAPGPDGYTFSFFQHNWDVVGKDVTDAIVLFFSSSIMPQS